MPYARRRVARRRAPTGGRRRYRAGRVTTTRSAGGRYRRSARNRGFRSRYSRR